jgi:hypothetical protein
VRLTRLSGTTQEQGTRWCIVRKNHERKRSHSARTAFEQTMRTASSRVRFTFYTRPRHVHTNTNWEGGGRIIVRCNKNYIWVPVFVQNHLVVPEPCKLCWRISNFRHTTQDDLLSFFQVFAFCVPFDMRNSWWIYINNIYTWTLHWGY